MAAVENLEIVVDVDIASALTALEELQEELQNVAERIEEVDAVGTEGVDVRTNVDQLDTELAALAGEIEAFEAAESIDIDTDVNHQQLAILRGVMRDAVSDAVGDGFADGVGDAIDSVGGTGRRWDPDFLGTGTRGGSRMGDISAGMDMLFGDPDRWSFRGGVSRLDLDLGDGRRGRLFRRLRESIGGAIQSIEDFDLRMSDIHNALARLVPLLLIFIATIPAVVTALVGLATAAIAAAAALAAIGGFGALGVGLEDGEFDMQNLTEVWNQIRDAFIDAFGPLAEQLEDEFMDAVDWLGRFFEAVADEGDALMALVDDAEGLGRFLLDFVPDALRVLAGLVEALAPAFGGLAEWLDRNFAGVIRSLIEHTMNVMSAVNALITLILQALPALVEMSIGFTVVANAILVVIGLLADLLGALGISPRLFGLAIGGALALASAVLLLRTRLITLVVDGIVYLFKAIFTWLFPAIFQATVAMYGLSTATLAAAAALTAFITVATLGAGLALAGMAISAASEFMGLAGSIGSATDALREFDRLANGAGGTFGGPGNPYGPDFDPDDPFQGGGGAAGVTVFNVESSGDEQADQSNMEYADWLSGRMTGG